LADRIPARLTAAQGRKFGLTVGIAFLVLAGISYWRGHYYPPRVLGGLGAVMALAGLLVPTYLGPVERGWMGFAHLLSKVTTPIFMGIVYYLVITPIALLMRLFGKNPLASPPASTTRWIVRTETRSNLENQF
jgi:hypothetical protein